MFGSVSPGNSLRLGGRTKLDVKLIFTRTSIRLIWGPQAAPRVSQAQQRFELSTFIDQAAILLAKFGKVDFMCAQEFLVARQNQNG